MADAKSEARPSGGQAYEEGMETGWAPAPAHTAREKTEGTSPAATQPRERAQARREEEGASARPEGEKKTGGEEAVNGGESMDREDDYHVPESMISNIRETYELLSRLRAEAERLRRFSASGGGGSDAA